MNDGPPSANPQYSPASDESEGLPFFARWSRRKLGQEPIATDACAAAGRSEADPSSDAAAPIEPQERVDPRTGKRMSDLTDEDMPDIESLDENSDLAAFMAGKVSRALRMKALGKVFHAAKFNQICLCAEYADDYTKFTPLGDVVPHDLKQAIVREASRLCEQLAEKGVTLTPEEAHKRVAAQYRSEQRSDLEMPREPMTTPGPVPPCPAGEAAPRPTSSTIDTEAT